MEGSPATLSPRHPAAQILDYGLIDWVDLGFARQFVMRHDPSVTADELRDKTLDVVGWLLKEGLVVAGDLDPDFVGWDLDAEGSLARITQLWIDPDHPLRPGDICWLCSTPAGDELAQSLS